MRMRDLDKDTRVFIFFFAPLGQTTILEFHPSSVTLRVSVFILIFCESLALSWATYSWESYRNLKPTVELSVV